MRGKISITIFIICITQRNAEKIETGKQSLGYYCCMMYVFITNDFLLLIIIISLIQEIVCIRAIVWNEKKLLRFNGRLVNYQGNLCMETKCKAQGCLRGFCLNWLISLCISCLNSSLCYTIPEWNLVRQKVKKRIPKSVIKHQLLN